MFFLTGVVVLVVVDVVVGVVVDVVRGASVTAGTDAFVGRVLVP